MLDHAGAADPGTGAAPRTRCKLASIAREIAYNDYQNGRAARGERADRNVIVALGKPAAATGMLVLTQSATVASRPPLPLRRRRGAGDAGDARLPGERRRLEGQRPLARCAWPARRPASAAPAARAHSCA